VAVVGLLSGCHGPASPSGSATASPPTSSASASPSSTPTATSAAGAACTRDSLKITYQGTDNTAGHFHGLLTFTNTSATPCTMNGYPTVYIGQPEAEETMGAVSTHDTTSSPSLVTLPPGAAAHATTTITDAGVVCEPVDTSYLIAAPPLTHPFDANADGQHVYNVIGSGCNDPSISLVEVGAITN
jgi:hypothetical protein